MAARAGSSIAQLDSVDRATLNAVAQRVSEGYYAGAAFKYVIDSRLQLFEPPSLSCALEPHTAVAKRGRDADSYEVESACAKRTPRFKAASPRVAPTRGHLR
jgi:hypothetical protein